MNHARRHALQLGLLVPTGLLLAKATLAREQPAGPAATDPLQRYIGSWQGEVTVESANAPPERYTQRNTFAWSLGGAFLEERGVGSNGSSFVGLWSREASGSYKAHYFLAPAGNVVALDQRWDAEKHSFVGSVDLGGGVAMLAEDHFHSSDAYEWSITVRDGKGATLSRMVGHERRVRR